MAPQEVLSECQKVVVWLFFFSFKNFLYFLTIWVTKQWQGMLRWTLGVLGDAQKLPECDSGQPALGVPR